MRTAAGTAAVVVIGGLLALGRPIQNADEAWFLQVLHRVSLGEVLYRDVFFGVTPLSVAVLAPLASVCGSELWLVRASMVACVAAMACLASWIARPHASPRGFSWRLAAALLLLAFPVPSALYAPLATLFLLLALAASLAWGDADGGRWPLALAGAACGACFALKQNIGLYALAAALLAVLSSAGSLVGVRRFLEGSGVVLASFAAVAVAALLPVWWSDAFPAFVDYAFLNKGVYVRSAAVGFLEGVRSASGAVALATFLLPPLAWSSLGLAWRASTGVDRRRVGIVAAYCAAATLGMFPRADDTHVAYVAPVFLVALAMAWDRLGLRRSRSGRLAQGAAGWGALALLGLRAAEPLLGLAAGTASVSSLPHFRGLVVPNAALSTIRTRAARLREAGGEGTFLLSSEAGFLYLASGLRNPTPFDYPLVTAFGQRGEARVVDAIRSGAISRVCMDRKLPDRPLRPPLLVAVVASEMALQGDTGFCRLYAPRF